MVGSTNILLGKGGPRPGLVACDVFSGSVEDVLSVPPGGSVYAVGLSPEGKTIAAGTKAGDLYWLRQGERDPATGVPLARRLANGAPVVSLCFADSSTAAVTDTMGRCLLWLLGEGARPDKLPAPGGVICSLFRLDEEQLAGLCVSGELLVWNWREKKIIKVLGIPALPETSALVTPVYWRSADTWVWPGRDGQIVFYEWRQGRLRTAGDRLGDVHVIMACGDQLLTIGRADGRLKRWRAAGRRPMHGRFRRHVTPR